MGATEGLTMLRFACLTGLLLISGCTQSTVSSSSLENIPENIGLVLNDCVGFELEVDYPWAIAPGEAPTGWEFAPLADGRLESYVLLEAVNCNRIAVLGFERGPVSVVFESHSKTIPPEACLAGSWIYFGILNQMYISDNEIASALEGQGFPAVYAPMNVTSSFNALISQTWQIAHSDGSQSTFEIVSSSLVDQDSNTIVGRFAWQEGAGTVAMMDVSWETLAAQGPAYVDARTEAMLMSQSPIVPPAIVELNTEMEAHAQVVFRGNSSCEEFSA